MLRKVFIVYFLLVCLSAGNAAAIVFNKGAAFTDEEIAFLNGLAGQYGVITEQDVENYIEIGKDMNKAFRKKNRVEAAKIMQQVGWKYNQGCYFDIKIKNGYWLLNDGEDFAHWLEDIRCPSGLVPSESEMKLINRYRGSLARIIGR